MKIDKLITVFENLIPIYQKAVDTNAKIVDIYDLNLEFGLCYLSKIEMNIDIESVFETYYKNYLTGDYIFPTIAYTKLSNSEALKECIIPRLNFLKEQVIELNKLKKQGYTHV